MLKETYNRQRSVCTTSRLSRWPKPGQGDREAKIRIENPEVSYKRVALGLARGAIVHNLCLNDLACVKLESRCSREVTIVDCTVLREMHCEGILGGLRSKPANKDSALPLSLGVHGLGRDGHCVRRLTRRGS